MSPEISPPSATISAQTCVDTDFHVSPTSILELPSDMLLTVFSFLSAIEVDKNLLAVCKIFRHEATSDALWKVFCRRTGKPIRTDADLSPRVFYFRIPCVPDDCPTISSALRNIDPTECMVTVQKGLYEESIVIDESILRDDMASYASDISIEAVDPGGVGILWTSGEGEACLSVLCPMKVSLKGFHFFHSTGGMDIWNGNSAILVKSPGASLFLDTCSIQSESGRGLVAMCGSDVHVKKTTVHDCAATGVYVGDPSTSLTVEHCNIVRNGAGSRRKGGGVPPGHSGLFVETTASARLEDLLLAANAYTGLSSLRGGRVIMSNSDVTRNGTASYLLDDPFDAGNLDGEEEDEGLRGHLEQVSEDESGQESNNFTAREMGNESVRRSKVIHGGYVRLPEHGLGIEHRWTKESFTAWYG